MKLSEAIQKGYEENPDIKHVRVTILGVIDGKLEECCAAGFGVVGLVGREAVEESRDKAYDIFVKEYGFQTPRTTILSDIWSWNDDERLSVPEIVERLKERGY